MVYSPAGTVASQVTLPLESLANPLVVGAIAYVTFLSVALAGATSATNVVVPAVPATALYVSGVNVTPVTGIVTSPLSGKLGQ